MADRAVAPAVGKVLEASLVVLFVMSVTTALYGGVVPSYRTAVGAEVGDRALVTATERIESAIPADGRTASAELHVDLPETLRGTAYTIAAENGTLVLDHPHPGIGGRATLALPSAVVAIDGRWDSQQTTVVVVRDVDGELRVVLQNR